MIKEDAVGWHTEIANQFEIKYKENRNFIERFTVWRNVISKYSGTEIRALDLGCGNGIYSAYMSPLNASVIGIDASEEMLKYCFSKKETLKLDNTVFIKADIRDLKKILPNKVDLIICSSVLEYLQGLKESLLILSSLLSEKGTIIFSLPNKKSLYRKCEHMFYLLTGRPKYYKFVKCTSAIKEVDKELNAMGFKVIEHAYYGETPFLSRIFRKFGAAQYSDNLFLIVAKPSNQ